MTNIAYKISKGDPNLPDGFVTDDHFETEENAVEGYLIIAKENFSQLLANNGPLVQAWEAAKGIVTVSTPTTEDPTTLGAPPPPTTKTPVVLSPEAKAEQQKIKDQQTKDQELFQQFVAWKNSQTSTT